MEAAMENSTLAREEPPRVRVRPHPSWSALAAMMLSVVLPISGWLVSISNRVAALEVKTESLATAAQMAEVKQKIDDWIQETDRVRIDDLARHERESK